MLLRLNPSPTNVDAITMGAEVRSDKDGADFERIIVETFPPRRLEQLGPIEGSSWRSYLNVDEFESGISDRQWTDLDPIFLEFHHDVIAFAPPHLFVELLPAWLDAVLHVHDGLDMLPYFLVSALVRPAMESDVEEFHARAALLSGAQRQVVRLALERMLGEPRLADHRDGISRALSFWATDAVESLRIEAVEG